MINLYQTCYDMLNQYIFGNSIVANTYPDLVVTLFSVTACLFCMAIPFIVVYAGIKLICWGFNK